MGQMATLLRARNREGEPLTASTYQYSPRFLVYQRDSNMDRVGDAQLGSAIKAMMPPELHQGWGLRLRNLVNPRNEAGVENVTRWMAVHGERRGYRTPSTRERSRAMGMDAYLADLGLTERVLYDAQGNSYDPQAVKIRLAEGIRQWSNG